MPITAFIGVRISWLMLARKSDLRSVRGLGRGARLLRVPEQPRVLDRDHRLVAEGLEQRELLVVKGNAWAAEAHYAIDADALCPFPRIGAHDHREVAECSSQLDDRRRRFGIAAASGSQIARLPGQRTLAVRRVGSSRCRNVARN